MRDFERRLVKAERRAQRPPPLSLEERAEAAAHRCNAGTANLDDLSLVLGDEPRRYLEQDLAHRVPDLLARRLAGRPEYTPLNVLTYPPGQDLPEDMHAHLRFVRFLALGPEDGLELPKNHPLLGLLTPEQRLANARLLLALGWPDAAPTRAVLWDERDGAWQLSPWVLEKAEAEEAERFPYAKWIKSTPQEQLQHAKPP